MDLKTSREFIELCKVLGVKPTCEGLNEYDNNKKGKTPKK